MNCVTTPFVEQRNHFMGFQLEKGQKNWLNMALFFNVTRNISNSKIHMGKSRVKQIGTFSILKKPLFCFLTFINNACDCLKNKFFKEKSLLERLKKRSLSLSLSL